MVIQSLKEAGAKLVNQRDGESGHYSESSSACTDDIGRQNRLLTGYVEWRHFLNADHYDVGLGTVFHSPDRR